MSLNMEEKIGLISHEAFVINFWEFYNAWVSKGAVTSKLEFADFDKFVIDRCGKQIHVVSKINILQIWCII